MKKHLTRAVVATALLATTTGCFALGINSQGMTKPVSLSASVGRSSKVVRHFEHRMATWYAVGLIPLATVPGPVPTWTPADKLVVTLLQDELAKGGDGVANLRVIQQFGAISIGLGLAKSVVAAVVPAAGTVLGLASTMDVVVAGDIVEFSGRAAGPVSGVVTSRDGEVDLGGVDVNTMVVKAISKQ